MGVVEFPPWKCRLFNAMELAYNNSNCKCQKSRKVKNIRIVMARCGFLSDDDDRLLLLMFICYQMGSRLRGLPVQLVDCIASRKVIHTIPLSLDSVCCSLWPIAVYYSLLRQIEDKPHSLFQHLHLHYSSELNSFYPYSTLLREIGIIDSFRGLRAF